MAVVVDFNNISAASILATINASSNNKFDLSGASEFLEIDFFRHVLLSSLLSYRRRFGNKSPMILCRDASNCWRKDFFPNYKARRHAKLEKPSEEQIENQRIWSEIYRLTDIVIQEVEEHLPYYVLKIDRCEGDDIVGVMTNSLSQHEPVTVVSNDKDFPQLCRDRNVSIYRPLSNTVLDVANPELFLKEMIIRGDSGDDVPNFLSDDDVFVTPNKRQKSIMSKKMPEYLAGDLRDFAPPENVERNEKMIDLRNVPEQYSAKILDLYSEKMEKKQTSRKKILSFLQERQLRKLIESVEEF